MLYFAAIEILQDRFITGSLIILIVIVLKLTKKYIKPNKLFQKNWDKILIIKKTMNIDNQSITLTDGPTIPLKDISDIKVRRRKLQVIFHDKLKKPINIPYIKLSYDPTLIREIILRKIYDLQY